jgi:hypothetical protein
LQVDAQAAKYTRSDNSPDAVGVTKAAVNQQFRTKTTAEARSDGPQAREAALIDLR